MRREFGNTLGWKNIEKYKEKNKLLIYMDPRILIMPPREFLRRYSIIFRSVKVVEQLAFILNNEVAKHIILEITPKKASQGEG